MAGIISSSCLTFISLNPKPHFYPYIKPLKFNIICSHNKQKQQQQQQQRQQQIRINSSDVVGVDVDVDVVVVTKKKRKPRPSFYDQIRDKWSIKQPVSTKILPWKVQGNEDKPLEIVGGNVGDRKIVTLVQSPNLNLFGVGSHGSKVNDNSKFVGGSHFGVNGGNDSDHEIGDDVYSRGSRNNEGCSESYVRESRGYVKAESGRVEKDDVFRRNNEDNPESYVRGSSKDIAIRGVEKDDVYSRGSWSNVNSSQSYGRESRKDITIRGVEKDDVYSSRSWNNKDNSESYVRNSREDRLYKGDVEDDVVTDGVVKGGVYSEDSWIDGDNSESYVRESSEDRHSRGHDEDGVFRKSWNNGDNSEGNVKESSKERLPWMSENDGEEERGKRRIKTELAEKTIPEHELKRLRNVALRMKERMKVGDAGITQALVDEIHERWKIDEVVKLKFEGPPAFQMKRSHQVLESKTGGLVIWRSGSSVVLYRGLTYKFDCVNTYKKDKGVNLDDFDRLEKNMSQEEMMEMRQIDDLLDGLGPRYIDWSGRPPMPVDADLLPAVVPGYRTPFRRLPHGVLRTLKDSQTTELRRQSRFMPAHFALGRNRELQGLAAAIVKLWEKSAVAKIAIKRGVLNTRNERMAEELKRLTGGTLLSRNKEFIVFYRGNDFLPPPVTQCLKEREKLTLLQYEEEDVHRHGLTLVRSNSKSRKRPLVAGTLAETIAATSRWTKQPSSDDVDKMLKDSAVARRASLARYLQHKQVIANAKLKKAERALAKVEKYLVPEELPTDLETITDEERLVFRRMGLSMKPFLLLGRREVFDGTIENMHLHWKFRELVKIIVGEKSFTQVKQIAISLEAESGGILVSIDKTTKGYNIIFYRGKNYRRPDRLRPRNLLTRRQALARSIELQRREGLKYHISSLQEQMELVKSDLEDLKDGKELDGKTFYEKLDDSTLPSDDEMEEDEDEEAYLLTYDARDEE